MTAEQFDKAVIAHLVGNAGVAALVSNRISFEPVPQYTTTPYIAVYYIYESTGYDLSGSTGLVNVTLQFTIVGSSHGECTSVRKALHDAFATSPITVTLSGTPVTIRFAKRESTSTGFNEETKRAYHTVRYEMYYTE